MTDEQILEMIKTILAESFDIQPECVVPEATLFDDFDLDSIDAVDLSVKIQDVTGKRFTSDEFRSIRTVGDVMTRVRETQP